MVLSKVGPPASRFYPLPALAFAAAVLTVILLAGPVAGQADEAVSVTVSAATAPGGVVATVSFSRPVQYRFEQTRARLRMWLDAPVEGSSFVDQDVEGDILKRIRFDEGGRGTAILFHLGRRFGSFTAVERTEPFRIVLSFLGEGAAPGSLEGLTAPGAPGQAPPGSGPPGYSPGTGRGASGSPGGQEGEGALHRVVIDPGHGGSEAGAVSRSGLKEKDLVLDIARRLRDRLRETGYFVALTREDDQAMDLDSRTSMANRLKADLFVSIHANSSQRTAVRGAETYYLSYGATDAEAMSLARTENLTTSVTDGSDLELVLWEMAQAAYLTRSSRLAGLIQSELNSVGGMDRGVKQAPFRVLVGAAMPAVLVEVGFLTHDEEEKELASGEHRDRIAAALAAAVNRFRQEEVASGGGAPRGRRTGGSSPAP